MRTSPERPDTDEALAVKDAAAPVSDIDEPMPAS